MALKVCDWKSFDNPVVWRELRYSLYFPIKRGAKELLRVVEFSNHLILVRCVAECKGTSISETNSCRLAANRATLTALRLAFVDFVGWNPIPHWSWQIQGLLECCFGWWWLGNSDLFWHDGRTDDLQGSEDWISVCETDYFPPSLRATKHNPCSQARGIDLLWFTHSVRCKTGNITTPYNTQNS